MGLVPEGKHLTKVRKMVDSFTHYPTLKLKLGYKTKVKLIYKIESPSRGSMKERWSQKNDETRLSGIVNFSHMSDPEDGGPARCNAAVAVPHTAVGRT
jgi:hypothetical protein